MDFVAKYTTKFLVLMTYIVGSAAISMMEVWVRLSLIGVIR